MYAMAGASRVHNRICLNISSHMLQMAPAHCRVTQSDMRLRLGEDYYYPDVMAVCAPEPEDAFHETSPCILVEVLSDSTKNIDLREKALAYKQIASLQTYLVIDPNSKTVRHFSRNPAGKWEQEDLEGNSSIALPCLGGSIALVDIYRGVL